MNLSVSDQQALVEKHLPLANRIARHYRGQGASFEDLRQEASIGLIEAARRFDPERTPPDHFGEYARSQVHKRVMALISDELQSRLTMPLADVPATEPDLRLERVGYEIWSALEVLDADDRELVADRYGLSGRTALGIPALCTRYNQSAAKIKRRLDEIRESLRVELAQRGWRERTADQVGHAQLNIG
jgi:RNA polymerase sigma factor (sigma-70 family)